MDFTQFSEVEKIFLQEAGIDRQTTRMPYITVENFPKLGLLSALRFLEWVSKNPEGVVSISAGKTSDYFLYFTHYLLDNWDEEKGKKLREKYGLGAITKPDMKGLQICTDE
jgi:glucosamine-6-phosphate deaminase